MIEEFRKLLNKTHSQLCFPSYLKTPVLLKSFFGVPEVLSRRFFFLQPFRASYSGAVMVKG